MAKTDYTTGMGSSGKTIAAQWPSLYSLLATLVPLVTGVKMLGASPNDEIEYVVWGGGVDPIGAPDNGAWRLRESANTFLIEERNGGSWQQRMLFAVGGAITASIAASSLTGSIADARVPASNVTQHAAAIEAAVSHDNLLGFVGNEHIDHSTVSISAGTGLTGGGAITATRTLNLANTAVTPGTYAKAQITVDAQGRITAALASSRETYKEKTGGDQATTLAVDTIVSFPTPDTGAGGFLFPGADGVKDYYVWYHVPFLKGAAGIDTWSVRVGTTGVAATDPAVLAFIRDSVINEDGLVAIGPIRVLNPSNTTVVSLSCLAATSAVTVRGGTTAVQKSTLLIMQASE